MDQEYNVWKEAFCPAQMIFDDWIYWLATDYLLFFSLKYLCWITFTYLFACFISKINLKTDFLFLCFHQKPNRSEENEICLSEMIPVRRRPEARSFGDVRLPSGDQTLVFKLGWLFLFCIVFIFAPSLIIPDSIRPSESSFSSQLWWRRPTCTHGLIAKQR